MTSSAVVKPGTNPLQLRRSHVEADFAAHLFRFQVSGLPDLFYSPKR